MGFFITYLRKVNDVIVIGGGLAGLINSILLRRAGLKVLLFEEKKYPFHRVCGEYISNEVIPYLRKINLFPEELNPTNISQFQLSAISGSFLKIPLDLGGFGISRYLFDSWLADKAKQEGVEIIHERIIESVMKNNHHAVTSKSGEVFESKVVIGAFGKRSTLDKNLDRPFISRRSPYIGVKYHIKTDYAVRDEIALHNFQGGYCGISMVENEVYNLCYLSHRSNLKKHGSIPNMERELIARNPHLKHLFNESEFLFEKPEVINEITFEKKEPVFNHILMSGDSAGMITPLCGNGMAMAIHSTKILSELIIKNFSEGFNRADLEDDYRAAWNSMFANRLLAGRKIQGLFGSANLSGTAVMFGKLFPPFTRYLMKKTHGSPIS